MTETKFTHSLYPYQQEIVNYIEKTGDKSCLNSLPIGAGKSIILKQLLKKVRGE